MEAGAPNGPVFASVFGNSSQMFPGHPINKWKEMNWHNWTNYSSILWEKKSSQVWNWGIPTFLKICCFNNYRNHRKNKNNYYHLLNLTYKSCRDGYKRFFRGNYQKSTSKTPKLVSESTITDSQEKRRTNILLGYNELRKCSLKNLTEHSWRKNI